ncbi:MAG TPA: hypothetical protein ENK91_10275 [Bacteroidetes bacterium]|nr:hypothetical protein [Bacteroidota bacterium]
MSYSGIKLFAPASLSFYSYGLKNLSICLDNPGNEIKAHIDDTYKTVTLDSYSKEKKDRFGSKEIIKEFAISFLSEFNANTGIKLEISNRIPFDSGLGFLEANITGTLIALNNLLKMHLDKTTIFNFILKNASEKNIRILPSNIAANLYGGIILYNEKAFNPIQKIYNPHGISFTLIPTKSHSNQNPFSQIPSELFPDQAVSIATLIKGLMIDDAELMATGINNNLFEKHLISNMDFMLDIREISFNNKVYALGLAHLGEIIFIVNPNTLIKEQNDAEITEYFKIKNIKLSLYNSNINLNGIYKY